VSSCGITIFEFTKPQRDDFVNKSSDEDPVQQIIRYVNNIIDGKYKTPQGKNMLVAANPVALDSSSLVAQCRPNARALEEPFLERSNLIPSF
jgi:hypothetical protein